MTIQHDDEKLIQAARWVESFSEEVEKAEGGTPLLC